MDLKKKANNMPSTHRQVSMSITRSLSPEVAISDICGPQSTSFDLIQKTVSIEEVLLPSKL
jgi:hypothetical protein